MPKAKKRFPYEHVIAILIGIALFYFGWQLKGLVSERSAAAEKTVRLRTLYLHLKSYCDEHGSFPSVKGKDRYSVKSGTEDLSPLFESGYIGEEEVKTNLWSYNANALPWSEEASISEKGAGKGKSTKMVLLLRANGEIIKAEPKGGMLPKDLCEWEKLGD